MKITWLMRQLVVIMIQSNWCTVTVSIKSLLDCHKDTQTETLRKVKSSILPKYWQSGIDLFMWMFSKAESDTTVMFKLMA